MYMYLIAVSSGGWLQASNHTSHEAGPRSRVALSVDVISRERDAERNVNVIT